MSRKSEGEQWPNAKPAIFAMTERLRQPLRRGSRIPLSHEFSSNMSE
jgi:hypothetical protein